MMDERSTRNEVSPQLLNLIPNERSEWQHQHHMRGEERKLELSLAPPGGEQQWSLNHHRTKNLNSERDESLLSLGYFPHATNNNNNNNNNNGFQTQKNMPSTWASNNNKGSSSSSPFLHQFPSSSSLSSPSSQPQSMPVMGKDASQAPCCTKVIDQLQSDAEKKVFSSSPSSAAANTAVPNTSQKRTSPGPVVGWPPIRSFRKNLASSSSSKPPTPPPESPHQHHQPNKKVAGGKKPVDNNYGKGMFVKINMDGVPIGRKVDLNAYHSYENLSTAVDELFRGLLAAQRDSSAGGVHNKQLEEEKPITGLLDGSGEYTLVYEDNEGDRILVGDVPWHMFVSTVKRLRVLKSTELSAFTLGGKQEKETT